ncbi:MAG: zinc-finger domain-containing protein [Acetobacteraceae bacterium]
MPEGATAQTETICVTEDVVACDGGGGPLGHPRVFLHVLNDEVVCPYCSRRFVRKPGVPPLSSGH